MREVLAQLFDQENIVVELRPDGSILSANAKFLDLFGYGPEALKHLNHAALVPETEVDLLAFVDTWNRLERGERFASSFRRRASDGRLIILHGAYAPILNIHGELETVFKIAHDITEMESARATALDDALAARKLAEAATRARDRLLANVSHELRTPLTTIDGLARRLRQQPSERVHDFATSIGEATATLTALVDDLLDAAQLESGRFRILPSLCSPRDILTNSLEPFVARAAEKGLTFQVSIVALPDRLVLDALRLRQILSNLAANAVKFTQVGGVQVYANWAEDQLTIRVEDSGLGFDEKDIARLFLPFEQVESLLSRSLGGIGLGLPICQQLVSAMGGSISAEGSPGRGARFTVTIPAATPPLSTPTLAPTLPSDQPTSAVSLNVLSAEDNPAIRLVLSHLLSAENCTPFFAANGEEAYELARKHTPDFFDLCLMDLRMPKCDGHECLKRIRSLPGGQDLWIYALSADLVGDGAGKALMDDFDGALGKPIRPETLAAVIEEARLNSTLRRKRRQAPHATGDQ
ncbi:ATP-binding response regulator [Phenylobacterium conjunctum]|jgi:PAS domain S-box-containing protein|uniref:histidine kinase n=1 Tax=Phenylobacterium conjunctum TaxID=1298959 RepID=A0ABW3SVW2_9CAUL